METFFDFIDSFERPLEFDTVILGAELFGYSYEQLKEKFRYFSKKILNSKHALNLFIPDEQVYKIFNDDSVYDLYIRYLSRMKFKGGDSIGDNCLSFVRTFSVKVLANISSRSVLLQCFSWVSCVIWNWEKRNGRNMW